MVQNNSAAGRSLMALLGFVLLGLVACCSLASMLLGIRAYRSTVDGMEQNYSRNTSLQYIATKVRQHDLGGAVYMDDLEGCQALVLEQELEGTAYQTWIYHYDGAVCELLVRRGQAEVTSPDLGQRILPLESLQISSPAPGLILLQSTGDDGHSALQVLYLRTWRGDSP